MPRTVTATKLQAEKRRVASAARARRFVDGKAMVERNSSAKNTSPPGQTEVAAKWTASTAMCKASVGPAVAAACPTRASAIRFNATRLSVANLKTRSLSMPVGRDEANRQIPTRAKIANLAIETRPNWVSVAIKAIREMSIL